MTFLPRTLSFVLFSCILTVAITGCDVFGFDERSKAQERLVEDVENAREKWETQGYSSYSFSYFSNIQGEVFVEVENREIVSARLFRDEISPEDALSISKFFDLIKESIGNENFTATFSQEFGYPIRFRAVIDGRLTEVQTQSLTQSSD